MLDGAMHQSGTRATPAQPGPSREGHASIAAPATSPVTLTLERRLQAHRLAARWLARCPGEPGAMLAYRLQADRPADTAALERALAFAHTHTLPIERTERDAEGRSWLLARFPGSYDGLLTLSALVARRLGGQLGAWETRHAVDHLLSALHDGRERGVAHGPVRPDEVVVDRRSRLRVELFGVESAVRGVDQGVSAELASVSQIALELLTGVPGGSSVEAARLRGPVGRAWRRWFDRAPGCASCAEAREALPG